MNLHVKLNYLKKELKNAGKVLLAFSGGVDSTLLASIGREVLGDSLKVITVNNGMQSHFELDRAQSLARDMGIPLEVLCINALQVEQIRKNDYKRCYYCKKRDCFKFCVNL